MQFILATVLLFVLSCTSSDDSPTNGPSDPLPTPVVIDPTPIPGPDLSYQKPYVRISPEGMKVGKCSMVENVSLWHKDHDFANSPPCPEGVKLGNSCNPNELQGCQKSSTEKFICTTRRAWECHGWVYEKEGPKYTELKGVKLNVFFFAGCMAGMCDPQSEVVETDSNGYFILKTHTLLDTLKITSPNGYFAHCNKGQPIGGGGTNLYQDGAQEPLTGGFWQYKIKPESCKFNNQPE